MITMKSIIEQSRDAVRQAREAKKSAPKPEKVKIGRGGRSKISKHTGDFGPRPTLAEVREALAQGLPNPRWQRQNKIWKQRRKERQREQEMLGQQLAHAGAAQNFEPKPTTPTKESAMRPINVNILMNLRTRWPDESRHLSDRELCDLYDEFSQSEDHGNNDEKFPQWLADSRPPTRDDNINN